MPGRAPPGYVTSFRGELIRVPLYLNHHWSSVLLSEVSNHTVTNDCLDSINLLIDELIWIIIQSVAFYQQPNCLSPVFGSPIYPIVRPPSEQAQFIRLPFHPSLLKTHGISRVLPNSIGRDSILEAEIALIAYDQRLRSLEPVNSRRRSVSGQQQTPMSLEDLYHQLQIECQVLSPYGSDFESSARNHSYQNLARSLPAPTRTRSGVKSSDIRSPRRPGRNERLMAPTGLVDHTIPILLDHNAFELELQLMSEQGMPGMPRPYSAPQAGPCLATTVMDPRSMIYLVGLIQSVSAYLLKGSIRALERSSDQSAVHAWHLVDFISEDDHVTGFCRLFEQMNVKKYIDIVCHPPLPDLMKPLLQQEEHDQGDQLVESYRLLPSSRIVKYRPSPGMLASPSYPMIIQPAPMSTSALISSTSGCDVAVELRARASAPSLRPSGLKLPDGSQPLPSGRSLRSMIPLPVSPSSSSIIGSPLRSPIPLSKNQSKTSSVVPPSQSITSLNDASRQGAASARGTVLQEGAIKGASFISNLEISTQPHPSNQASSTALHSAPVLCAYSPSNLNSLSQSSLTPETFNNHNQSIPEPRKPRDVNFQSADSGSSSIASYSCSSASSSISSASVYPKSGTISVATSKPSYQPLAAPENRKAAVRRSRSWTTLSQSLLYPESDNPNSQTSVKLNEVKNNVTQNAIGTTAPNPTKPPGIAADRFEQLITSNETLKVSLTPLQFLDSHEMSPGSSRSGSSRAHSLKKSQAPHSGNSSSHKRNVSVKSISAPILPHKRHSSGPIKLESKFVKSSERFDDDSDYILNLQRACASQGAESSDNDLVLGSKIPRSPSINSTSPLSSSIGSDSIRGKPAPKLQSLSEFLSSEPPPTFGAPRAPMKPLTTLEPLFEPDYPINGPPRSSSKSTDRRKGGGKLAKQLLEDSSSTSSFLDHPTSKPPSVAWAESPNQWKSASGDSLSGKSHKAQERGSKNRVSDSSSGDIKAETIVRPQEGRLRGFKSLISKLKGKEDPLTYNLKANRTSSSDGKRRVAPQQNVTSSMTGAPNPRRKRVHTQGSAIHRLDLSLGDGVGFSSNSKVYGSSYERTKINQKMSSSATFLPRGAGLPPIANRSAKVSAAAEDCLKGDSELIGRDSQNTLNHGGKTDEPIARNGIQKEKIRTKTEDSQSSGTSHGTITNPDSTGLIGSQSSARGPSFAERKDSSFKSRRDACQSSQSPDLVNVLLQQAENREIFSKFPVEKTGCRSKVINQADYKDINNFKGRKSEEDDSKLDYDVEVCRILVAREARPQMKLLSKSSSEGTNELLERGTLKSAPKLGDRCCDVMLEPVAELQKLKKVMSDLNQKIEALSGCRNRGGKLTMAKETRGIEINGIINMLQAEIDWLKTMA